MGLCPKPRDLTLWPNPGAAAGPDGTAVRWPGLRTCTALGLRPRIALSSVRHRTTYHDPGIAGRSVYTKSLTPPEQQEMSHRHNGPLFPHSRLQTLEPAF